MSDFHYLGSKPRFRMKANIWQCDRKEISHETSLREVLHHHIPDYKENSEFLLSLEQPVG